jgi:D-alanyl-D-alanine carboxypeptidase
MRCRLFLACSLALTFLAAPVTSQEGRLTSVLEEFKERYAFPGATAAIALPDGTVVTAATGLADVEAGRAMTPETPMLAASIGKSFVAATVLALESEGRLSRDDLLSVHLGDRPWFDALPNAGHDHRSPPAPHVRAAGPCASAGVPAGLGRAGQRADLRPGRPDRPS